VNTIDATNDCAQSLMQLFCEFVMFIEIQTIAHYWTGRANYVLCWAAL